MNKNLSGPFTVTYIHHDCFMVESPLCTIVFDYWTDPQSPSGQAPRFLDRIPAGRPLYVFVSHHHKDHFTKEIFSWASRLPNIHYIISKDTAQFCRHIMSPTSVYAGPKVNPAKVTELRRGHTFDDGLLKAVAFGSTDIGNSYMIETQGARIFHAGDLNAWIWKDESTPGEVKQALDLFQSKMKEITAVLHGGRVDICFFPVDSRIGSEYWTGARIFLERVDTGAFFPMHFGLGDEAEQRQRRLDASRADLYAPAGSAVRIIGPLAPYGIYRTPE